MPDNRSTSDDVSRNTVLGLRLRQRREELGLSGAAVARRARIGARRYHNYEKDERTPDPATLQKISAALETTMDELLSAAPVLFHRDPETYDAMRRFEEAGIELSGEQLQMLADVAEVARQRRRDEIARQARLYERDPFVPALSKALSDLALVYERLLPAIIHGHRPKRVEATVLERSNGVLLINVIVNYAPDTDPDVAASSLCRLAKERLPVRDADLEVMSKDKSQGAAQVILRVVCGAKGG